MNLGTWSELLRRARAAAVNDVDPIDAEYLLAYVLGRSRAALYARLADVGSSTEVQRFQQLWTRRCAGEPYAYLVGEREFFGRSFRVNPSVLIPRPDTETLLQAALLRWAPDGSGTVVDAGTGSGALAISFQLERPNSQVLATDASMEALLVARANAQQLKAGVYFWRGDWLQALASNSVDLILSNPPYLAADDPHLPGLVASGEPVSALRADLAGMADLITLVTDARRVLRQGAWLLLEHGWTQAVAVREALQVQGYGEVFSERDLGGHERISGGRSNWAQMSTQKDADC